MSATSSEPSSPTAAQVVTNPLPSSQIQLINIKTHVPIVLDLHESNYGQWSQFFHVVFGKFGLGDHIDSSSAVQGDSDWVQNDFSIVSWFYTTVSGEILQIVLSPDDTTYSLWRSIQSLFRDNKETRSVYIGAEFWSLYQGDMTVMAYCTKLKTLADNLRDLGSPVTDKDLVLNLLRGLTPRLHNAVPVLTMQSPFPSFLKARSCLLLEEHRVAQTARMAQAAALMAQAPSGAIPPGFSMPAYFGLASQAPFSHATPQSTRPSHAGGYSSGGQGGKKTKAKKKGNGDGSSNASRPSQSAASPSFAWPPGANPWAGMFQAWPVPRAPAGMPGAGLLGVRPGVPAPQALHVAQAPTANPY